MIRLSGSSSANPRPTTLPTITWRPADRTRPGDLTGTLASLLLSIVRKRQEKQAADRAGDSDHHEDHNHQ
jgi:hypothetical protein